MQSNCNIAHTFAELEEFLQRTIDRSDFQLSSVPLSDQSDWQIIDGALSHFSGGFFHVNGLRKQGSEEEHLVLFQPQSALTGLALHKRNGVPYVLLQARIEPGNSGVGQYGPTIQSTPANYQRVHGGKQTSYLNLFATYSPMAQPLVASMQLDLGKRYYHKSKFHIYVEAPELLETEENMIWATLSAIGDAFDKSNFLNADLRSLLSIFDWDLFSYKNQFSSEFYDRGQLDIYNAFNTKSNHDDASWMFVPITSLQGWKVADEGIIDVSGSGVSVSLYKTSCTTREVSSWIQPLMKSTSQGLVELVMRKTEKGMEFLVSVRKEFGVSGGTTVLPSIVVYPGEDFTDRSLSEVGVVVSEFIQSDEGGRFFQHESIYRLIQTTIEFEIEESQFWVSVSTLKQLLKTSNMVSFQLRCIASLVAEKLNPFSFNA